MFERGKIVLVPFPFTDLSAQKIRPAIIISNPTFLKENVIVVFVTSKKTKAHPKTLVAIKKTSRDFQKTGLKIDSTIRCDKIATLERTLVLGEIGFLSKPFMQRISTSLKSILNV